jgi:hypothetical protein
MLWRIDLKCTVCDWTKRDHWGRRGEDLPSCVVCGCATERAWLMGSFPNVIGDEIDLWVEHISATPEHFTSKAEHRRRVKELGFRIRDEHCSAPGTDKNKNVSKWI